jgi:hypothetical protein
MINEFDGVKLLFVSGPVNQLLYELKFRANESLRTNVSGDQLICGFRQFILNWVQSVAIKTQFVTSLVIFGNI